MTEPTNDSSLSDKETVYLSHLFHLCFSILKSPFKRAQCVAEKFATLNHINVLPLIWATIEPSQFTMVFPWAERGTLTSYIDGMHDKLIDLQMLELACIIIFVLFTRVECSSL